MYTIDWTAVIAIALIALVVIFIRISWTLKEICDAISARGSAASGEPYEARSKTSAVASAKSETSAAKVEEIDDTEIAAVIAIASQAMRAAS